MNESSAGRLDEMIDTTRAVSCPFSPDSKDMATRYLWAKKSLRGGEQRYLPLYAHLADAAAAGRLLWERWAPENIKRQLPQKLVVFLAAVHDLGKATPVFQSKRSRGENEELDEFLMKAIRDAGLPLRDGYSDGSKTRHELASHAILERQGLHESLCVVLSGHHGKPPNVGQIKNLRGYPAQLGFDKDEWKQTQDDLFRDALACSGFTLEEAKQLRLTRPQQALMSGLVILADWIASDEELFPLIDVDDDDPIDSVRRAETAFGKLGLPPHWEADAGGYDLYYRRFEIEQERSVQEAALKVAHKSPGIMVIEAPMGEGKTEAALVAAEVLAGSRGLRGVYFALPTQATSNAMFDRVLKWIKTFDSDGEPYSVRLAHGKAELNEEYRMLMNVSDKVSTDDDDCTAFVHEWFKGRKKGMLADFAVGTIDHVLMAALKQKHLALRHLGLAGKAVIVDEVHAYDIYMHSYLLSALAWLGAYEVPVIVLSATLPAGRRRELIDAYTGKTGEPIQTSAYPLITYSQGDKTEWEEVGGERRRRTVFVERTGDGDLAEKLEEALLGGGCAGVVVNTVGRAQEIYIELRERFGTDCVRLLHARLLACDRARLEAHLGEWLGPPDKIKERPKKLILVGTQVLEQSLDFDFDILVSDLCPMDLLLQRMGRLHRHERERPERVGAAVCLVMGADVEKGLERGAETIYGPYLLQRTRALLPDEVRLPDDIPRLVAGVYDEENSEEFAGAREEYEARNAIQKSAAKAFQIGQPTTGRNLLTGWLNTSIRDDSEKRGEAAVRDGADSVEAVVIQRSKGELHLLPWIENGRVIPLSTPDRELATVLAGCCVRLPALFGGEWIVDQAIRELEETMAKYHLQTAWYVSSLLKGALCLILDENSEATLCGYQLRYDPILGLQHKKEER